MNHYLPCKAFNSYCLMLPLDCSTWGPLLVTRRDNLHVVADWLQRIHGSNTRLLALTTLELSPFLSSSFFIYEVLDFRHLRLLIPLLVTSHQLILGLLVEDAPGTFRWHVLSLSDCQEVDLFQCYMLHTYMPGLLTIRASSAPGSRHNRRITLTDL